MIFQYFSMESSPDPQILCFKSSNGNPSFWRLLNKMGRGFETFPFCYSYLQRSNLTTMLLQRVDQPPTSKPCFFSNILILIIFDPWPSDDSQQLELQHLGFHEQMCQESERTSRSETKSEPDIVRTYYIGLSLWDGIFSGMGLAWFGLGWSHVLFVQSKCRRNQSTSC